MDTLILIEPWPADQDPDTDPSLFYALAYTEEFWMASFGFGAPPVTIPSFSCPARSSFKYFVYYFFGCCNIMCSTVACRRTKSCTSDVVTLDHPFTSNFEVHLNPLGDGRCQFVRSAVDSRNYYLTWRITMKCCFIFGEWWQSHEQFCSMRLKCLLGEHVAP